MTLRSRLIGQFERFAVLLELDGANSFKSGAYERAIRALSDESLDIEAHLRAGTITAIDGIGKGIAEKIVEYHATEKIAELETLAAKFPAGVVDLTRIPGFGAKKARAVYESLGVASIEQLEDACQDGRLADLRGFGKKSAEKILQGIEQLRKHSGRFRIDTAWEAARPILAALRAHPAVLRAETAGSLRRWRETAKDLDFVVATNDADSVMEAFVKMPGVESVTGRGTTKASVLLDSGMAADLRCVSPAQFPFALQHFTGSKEHNTAIRARAKERGFRSNEYGLFPEGSEDSLPAETEADIYRHLGLDYIEPELREDMGEIDAAEKHALPGLVERGDFRGLMHMHTTYSDGRPSLEDYARWASENGISWMGIADHSQAAFYANGMKPDRVRVQWAEINKLNKEWRDRGVRLLRGVESDILADGSLDYDDETLAGFDFVVASVHSNFTLSEDEQTARILRAVENPHTTILGHMTGRLLLKRDGYALRQKEIIQRCAQLGVVIEINANPYRLDMDWRLVPYALECGCMLCVSPDAHDISWLDHLRYGIGVARKGWITAANLANCLTADEFIALARKRRAK